MLAPCRDALIFQGKKKIENPKLHVFSLKKKFTPKCSLLLFILYFVIQFLGNYYRGKMNFFSFFFWPFSVSGTVRGTFDLLAACALLVAVHGI